MEHATTHCDGCGRTARPGVGHRAPQGWRYRADRALFCPGCVRGRIPADALAGW